MRPGSMDLYWGIKAQRERICAPVDLVGCSAVPPGVEGEERKFYVLISLLLSSQTRDEVTHEAMVNLHKLVGKLTPEYVLRFSEEEIHWVVRKVGYHNKKVVFMRMIAEKLLGRGMPETLQDVLSLPGIGKKMGYLYLMHACGKNLGIGVDTHVHRIANRIGLVDAKTPEKTRVQLEMLVPVDEWGELNRVMVGFGQIICKPVSPLCSQCDISGHCPSSRAACRVKES